MTFGRWTVKRVAVRGGRHFLAIVFIGVASSCWAYAARLCDIQVVLDGAVRGCVMMGLLLVGPGARGQFAGAHRLCKPVLGLAWLDVR